MRQRMRARSSVRSHPSCTNCGMVLASPSGLRVTFLGQFCVGLAVSVCAAATHGQTSRPSAATGGNRAELLSMPSGRLMAEGAWWTGLKAAPPVVEFDSEIAVLPWLQLGMGITGYQGTRAFSPQGNFAAYGIYKDKTSVLRASLWDETPVIPQATVSLYDPIGTGLKKGNALAFAKRFGEWDASLGVGTGRLNGVFGGIRYQPARLRGWEFMAERDVIDYSKPAGLGGGGTKEAGLPNGRQPIAFGAVYYAEQWGAGIARKHGATELKVFSQLDLERKLWTPKTEDPPRSVGINPRPTGAQWAADSAPAESLHRALKLQGFQAVKSRYVDRVFTISLTHPDLPRPSQAAGRAAQAALALGPVELREVVVLYADPETGLDVAEFRFQDVVKLQQYLLGDLPRASLEPSIGVRWLNPGAHALMRSDFADLVDKRWRFEVGSSSASPLGVALSGPRQTYRLEPKLSAFLNGPAAFQYGLKLQFDADLRLGPHSRFQVQASKAVKENFSGYPNVTRSDLPRVRSEFFKYEEGLNLKLDRALLHHYVQPAANVYARYSLGFYELSFAGVGTQWLWLPPQGPLSYELSVDALRQRKPGSATKMGDYKAVTALAAAHYELADGVTLTGRAGRFLARDLGVRIEAKRRFASGIELGGWYSVTDAKDFGVTPDKNYRDKGVFMNVPLDTLLTRSSRVRVDLAIAPWTRDSAQAVESPADLYKMLAGHRRNLANERGVSRLADVDDDAPTSSRSAVGLRTPVGDTAAQSLRRFAKYPPELRWGDAGIALLAIAAAARLDERVDTRLRSSAEPERARKAARATDALPRLGMGYAALRALDANDPKASWLGRSAFEAGVLAAASTEVIKRAAKRERPQLGLQAPARDAFPSRHTAVAFALAVPYAVESGNPWVYVLAGATGLGRVASREHWLSDVVAGGLWGAALGHYVVGVRSGELRAAGAAGLQLSPGQLAWSGTW